MDKSLLVEVFVPIFDDTGNDGGGKFGAIGTGYPVGRDIILTARHVIEQWDRRYPIGVRWHDYPNAGPSEGWFDLKPEDVIWKGKDEIDAVLLRCPRPPEAGPYFGILTAEPPPQDARWSSAGFPAAAKRDGRREHASFAGRMHSMSPKWRRFELDADVSPSDEEGWKGASGMPIFGHGGTRIFGLAIEVPLKFKNRKLHAVPACKLLDDDDFKKAIGYADQRDRRQKFERWLTAILHKSTIAIDLIQKYSNLLDGVDLVPDDRAACAARALLDHQIEEAIAGLAAAHEKILEELPYNSSDDLTAAAGVLLEAVLLISPYLFDHGVANGVRNHILSPEAALLEIPCVAPTVAEIVMAAAEDRTSEFRTGNDQIPVGLRQLPHPPETGIAGSKGHSEEIRESLMGKFIPGSWTDIRGDIDDYMFKRFPAMGGPDPTREQRIILASLALKNQSRNKKYYMIYRMPKDEACRRELEDGLRRLKKDYPSLIFLGLSEDFSVRVDEVRVYDPLRLMLGQKLPKTKRSPKKI